MNSILRSTLALTIALTAVPTTGTAAEPTARDHFYEAALQTGNEEPAWRAIRTSFLVRHDSTGEDPVFREVGEKAAFRTGDSFRVRVESNLDGYVYLFLRNSDGDLKLLFPYESGKTNRLYAFESRLVPAKTWFRMDKATGTEQIFVFLGAKPIAELEQMKKGTKPEMLKDLERLMEKSGKPDYLRYDEADRSGEDVLGATYYAEKRTAKRLFLVRRIELEHKTD